MILVTGATGNVGAPLTALLTERGLPLRVLVRDPNRAPQGVDAAVGDLTDPASLDAALAGVDTVVLISPAVPAQEIAAIDAAQRAGVTHVVKATSKASADSPVERRRGQTRIEEHLAATGLPHTLLRSNAYLQNLLALAPQVRAGGAFVMSAGDGQVGMVDARDVAAVAAVVAADPAAHAGATYWPTGPALVSYADVAATLTDVLGRPVDYRRTSPDEHREAMVRAGVPEAVATSNAQAFGLIAEGDAAWLTHDVERLTSTPPRSLRTFVQERAVAFG